MTTQEQYIALIKEMVTKKFGRTIATPEDAQHLAEEINSTTAMEVTTTSLLGIFSSDGRGGAPRPATLSAMARYVGYSGWSDFCTSSDILPSVETNVIPVTHRWGVILLTIIAIAVVITTVVLLIGGGSAPERSNINAETQVIEQEWLARTIEECNEIRRYAESNDYQQRIEEFCLEQETELYDHIVADIESYIQEHDLDYDAEAIAECAEEIASKCRNGYEALKIERSE